MNGRLISWLLGPLPGLAYELKQAIDSAKKQEALDKSSESRDLVNKIENGSLSASDALAQIAAAGYETSPEVDSSLSDLLSAQRTEEARQYETQMANTDILRAASQLGALGLGPSNVLQTGGSATPNVAAAATPKLNNANQRFDRNVQMTNALLGVGSRLASAGIYGSTLHAVNAASRKLAAAAAHSGQVVRHFDRFGELTGSTETTTVSSKHLDDILR